jgi:hypothetical protein
VARGSGQIRPWLRFAARAGKGLDDHIGSPRFRAMFENAAIGISIWMWPRKIVVTKNDVRVERLVRSPAMRW